MKYIDADKLTELISQTEKEFTEKAETKGYTTLEYRLKAEGLHLALQYITSLQQEQPEVEEELVNYFGAMPDDKDKIALARHFYELGLNARKGGLIMTQIEQIRDFVETIKKSYEGTIIPPSKQEFILALVCLLKFIDSLPADSKIERKEFQRGYEKGFKDGALGSEIIESFSAKSKEN